MKTHEILFSVCLCVLPALALAHETPHTGDSNAKTRSDTRREWTQEDTARAAEKLHEINLEEVEIGQLAKQNGVTEGVTEFGKMLASDHGDSDAKVVEFAKQHGIALRDKLPADSDAASAILKLRALRGADFERQFLDMMVEGHEKALALVKTWRKDTSDRELRAMLAATLPKLEHHLATAKALSGEK